MGIYNTSIVTLTCDQGHDTDSPCPVALKVYASNERQAIVTAERAGWEIMDIPERRAYCPKHNCYRLD